jgi:hypothetical protein
MTDDKKQQDNSGEESQKNEAEPKVTTSEDFEFTDSTFKRGQQPSDLEKRKKP